MGILGRLNLFVRGFCLATLWWFNLLVLFAKIFAGCAWQVINYLKQGFLLFFRRNAANCRHSPKKNDRPSFNVKKKAMNKIADIDRHFIELAQLEAESAASAQACVRYDHTDGLIVEGLAVTQRQLFFKHLKRSNTTPSRSKI